MKIMRSLCCELKSHPPHSSSGASAMFGFMLGLNLVVYVVKYVKVWIEQYLNFFHVYKL